MRDVIFRLFVVLVASPRVMMRISLKQACESDYRSLPALTVASLISEDRFSLPDNYRKEDSV